MSARPLLLGHRGTPRLHHENTLLGFQAALDAGLDGVELDVRRLADGTLVVHHDLALLDDRPLDTLNRKQLPAFVPTLDEVLDWAAQTNAYLNVEIKFEGLMQADARVPDTLRAIRRHGRAGRCIVSSFSPRVLAAAQAADPGIERGLLYHRPYRLGIGRLGLDIVPVVARRLAVTALHPHHSLIDRDLMNLCDAEGWRVNTWTVNEPSDAARLRQLGVDALIGDVPEVLLGVTA